MQQSSLAFLGCGSVRILFSRCLRGKWALFERLVACIVSHCSSALSNIASALRLQKIKEILKAWIEIYEMRMKVWKWTWSSH